MITVGIIGCGFVGGALKAWLEENNPAVKILVSDPPKGMNDPMDGADVFFLQIHVPTEDDGTQDLTLMNDFLFSVVMRQEQYSLPYKARISQSFSIIKISSNMRLLYSCCLLP